MGKVSISYRSVEYNWVKPYIHIKENLQIKKIRQIINVW